MRILILATLLTACQPVEMGCWNIITQEWSEKLENEVRELRAEIIAIKTTPKINPDIYPWQQPQVRFTPCSYQVYNPTTGQPEQKD